MTNAPTVIMMIGMEDARSLICTTNPLLILHHPTGARRWLHMPAGWTHEVRPDTTVTVGGVGVRGESSQFPVRLDREVLAAFLARLNASRGATEGRGEAGCAMVAHALGYHVRFTAEDTRVRTSVTTNLPPSRDRCWLDRVGVECLVLDITPPSVTDKQMVDWGRVPWFKGMP